MIVQSLSFDDVPTIAPVSPERSISKNGNGHWHAPIEFNHTNSARPISVRVENVRMPPHNVEAEEAVLGSVLIDPPCFAIVKPMIASGDFFVVGNGWVWEAFCSLHERRAPIDFLTVCEELSRAGRLVEIGGEPRVSRLTSVVPTAIHIREYAAIVARASHQRRVLRAAADLAVLAYEDDNDIDGLQAKVVSTARACAGSAMSGDSHVMTAEQASSATIDLLRDYHEHPLLPGQVRGIPTGLADLDRLVRGLRRGNLDILAGRPGMGKSSLLFQIGYNVAYLGMRVCVFSMEMSTRSVWERRLSAELGIELDRIESGRLSSDEYVKALEALGRLSELSIVIDDDRGLTTARMERVIAERGPFDLVLIDHLLLFRDKREGDTNVANHWGNVSRAVRQIGFDYNTAVLSACQLSRKCEERNDKRPILSDLRDSGEIEQNADSVMMIYRDEYYNKDTAVPHVAEIALRKMREGQMHGQADLYFEAKYTRFSQLVKRDLSEFVK